MDTQFFSMWSVGKIMSALRRNLNCLVRYVLQCWTINSSYFSMQIMWWNCTEWKGVGESFRVALNLTFSCSAEAEFGRISELKFGRSWSRSRIWLKLVFWSQNNTPVIQESLANANVKRATAVHVWRHMTSIGTTVAKLWPFLYVQDGRQPPSWILSNRK